MALIWDRPECILSLSFRRHKSRQSAGEPGSIEQQDERGAEKRWQDTYTGSHHRHAAAVQFSGLVLRLNSERSIGGLDSTT